MRIRTVKPEFWTNEKMSTLPDFTRLLALALLNYADDQGFFWANVLMIRGAVFPFDDDSSRIRRALAQLATQGYLRLGKTTDGREVGQIVKFTIHQKIDRPSKALIEPLAQFDDDSTMIRRALDDDSSLDRKGSEGIGSIAPTPLPHARPRDPLFDSLAQSCGSDPKQLTRRAATACAVALADIRRVCVDVTPNEIERRAANYRSHFDAVLTPSALCNQWAKCDKPASSNGTHKPHPLPGSLRNPAEIPDYTVLDK